ncbi:hypothetical protein TIFTF001_030680 [Ficus carica]|uniref:Uncharacterized protein n=1 Tax=Ficus carica TaxID=3494 RepID=A0AA88DUV0_FICCA|nr:hypothetical protein TIFTF001_030680 [Ficus carica]
MIHSPPISSPSRDHETRDSHHCEAEIDELFVEIAKLGLGVAFSSDGVESSLMTNNVDNYDGGFQ